MNEYRMLLSKPFIADDLIADIRDCLLANGHTKESAYAFISRMHVYRFPWYLSDSADGQFIYGGQIPEPISKILLADQMRGV